MSPLATLPRHLALRLRSASCRLLRALSWEWKASAVQLDGTACCTARGLALAARIRLQLLLPEGVELTIYIG
jgi:hypothetical protein